MSAFGRVTCGWGDRFVVNASLRSDGSSRFGPDNKWGTFRRCSVAWFVSNESFLRGPRPDHGPQAQSELGRDRE